MTEISITVNGARQDHRVEPRLHLADFIRDQCDLTGTHLGCEHGVCGACTILVDEVPVRSCLMPAVACHGGSVQTIEGLDDDPLMIRLRRAFTEAHALQCGYCTPGMLVTARDIVRRLPDADEARIRLELSGNLCRCTGYDGIVTAIRRVLADGVVPAPAAAKIRRAEVSQTSGSVAVVSAPDETARTGDGTRLEQSLDLAVPALDVWRAFQDPGLVAACIPGAALTDIAADGALTGTVSVSLGPIKAGFSGSARLSFDEAARRGRLFGNGTDKISGSRLTAEVTFSLIETGPSSCRLELETDYRLRGPLAQFGRPAIVREIAGDLVTTIGRNLEARLLGSAPPSVEAPSLNGLTLFGRIIGRWLRALFGRA